MSNGSNIPYLIVKQMALPQTFEEIIKTIWAGGRWTQIENAKVLEACMMISSHSPHVEPRIHEVPLGLKDLEFSVINFISSINIDIDRLIKEKALQIGFESGGYKAYLWFYLLSDDVFHKYILNTNAHFPMKDATFWFVDAYKIFRLSQKVCQELVKKMEVVIVLGQYIEFDDIIYLIPHETIDLIQEVQAGSWLKRAINSIDAQKEFNKARIEHQRAQKSS